MRIFGIKYVNLHHGVKRANAEHKYRVGQVVKFESTLRSLTGERGIIFGKIIECVRDIDGGLWYRIEEYPEKTEYGWNVPENKLTPVSLMEM